MGKFEKKIRKRLDDEKEEFNVWFEKNHEKLQDFSDYCKIEDAEREGNTIKVNNKKVWLIPIGFMLVVLCLFLCFLPMLVPEKTPSHFGNDDVHSMELNAEEQKEILQQNPFISKLENLTFLKLLKNEDDSLVFVIADGEIETESDFYFVNIQIEIDPYYHFTSKPIYSELANYTKKGEYSIHYEKKYVDTDDINWYYMLAEKGKQKIYWEVCCFEESIEQFINLMFD